MNSSGKVVPGRLLVALYAVMSLVAILYVPYFFSPRPSASDSYVFGYNNRLGVALLLFFSITGAIWTKGCGINLRSAAATKNISFRTWICVGITLTGCIAMILYAGRFGRACWSRPKRSTGYGSCLRRKPHMSTSNGPLGSSCSMGRSGSAICCISASLKLVTYFGCWLPLPG